MSSKTVSIIDLNSIVAFSQWPDSQDLASERIFRGRPSLMRTQGHREGFGFLQEFPLPMWWFFPGTLAAIQRRASCWNCCTFPHLQCWSALFADCKGGYRRSISVFWCGTVLKLGFGHHRLPYEQCVRSTRVCERHCGLDWYAFKLFVIIDVSSFPMFVEQC